MKLSPETVGEIGGHIYRQTQNCMNLKFVGRGRGIKQFCHEYMQVCQVWLYKRESPSFQQ